MSTKSHRKHLSRNKKGGGSFDTSANIAQSPTSTHHHEAVVTPDLPIISKNTQSAKISLIYYPHATTELRTISILGGIILVILVVLALIIQ
ncbi:hypothetical protein ACFLTP_06095 [Chloroflexota bacterium]